MYVQFVYIYVIFEFWIVIIVNNTGTFAGITWVLASASVFLAFCKTSLVLCALCSRQPLTRPMYLCTYVLLVYFMNA